jgi:hypothetical protein
MRLSRIVRRQPKAQRAAAMELSMPVQALLFKWNLVHKSRLPDGIDVGTAAAVLALAGFRDVRPVAREFLTLTKRCQLAAVLRQLRDAERRTRHKERGLEILAGKARIDLQLDVDEESVLRLLAAFQWTQRSSQHSSKPEKWHFLS